MMILATWIMIITQLASVKAAGTPSYALKLDEALYKSSLEKPYARNGILATEETTENTIQGISMNTIFRLIKDFITEKEIQLVDLTKKQRIGVIDYRYKGRTSTVESFAEKICFGIYEIVGVDKRNMPYAQELLNMIQEDSRREENKALLAGNFGVYAKENHPIVTEYKEKLKLEQGQGLWATDDTIMDLKQYDIMPWIREILSLDEHTSIGKQIQFEDVLKALLNVIDREFEKRKNFVVIEELDEIVFVVEDNEIKLEDVLELILKFTPEEKPIRQTAKTLSSQRTKYYTMTRPAERKNLMQRLDVWMESKAKRDHRRSQPIPENWEPFTLTEGN